MKEAARNNPKKADEKALSLRCATGTKPVKNQQKLEGSLITLLALTQNITKPLGIATWAQKRDAAIYLFAEKCTSKMQEQ